MSRKNRYFKKKIVIIKINGFFVLISTNRRSLIYNPNSTLFNQNLLNPNNSTTTKVNFYTSASAGPQSPSIFTNQSPVTNILGNQTNFLSLNQFNIRNKLKQYRSNCCIGSNNIPFETADNFSLSSSICSSLSPSPITIVNRHNRLLLSTPPSNNQFCFSSNSKNSQLPVSSPKIENTSPLPASKSIFR